MRAYRSEVEEVVRDGGRRSIFLLLGGGSGLPEEAAGLDVVVHLGFLWGENAVTERGGKKRREQGMVNRNERREAIITILLNIN